MKKLNEREEAIKQGYLEALKNGFACCLGNSCNWSKGKIKKGGNRTIMFNTPDGLSYKANQQYIERVFFGE